MKTANYSTEIVSHTTPLQGAKSFSNASWFASASVRSERLVFCVLMKPARRFIRNFSALCVRVHIGAPPPLFSHPRTHSHSHYLCNAAVAAAGGGTTIESNKYKRQYCRRAHKKKVPAR
jgi:hypothetical protein